MSLLTFNEGSFLNSGFARGVNFVVWVLLFSVCLSVDNVIKVPVWRLFVIAFLTGVATSCCLSYVSKKTTFYEWDYTERKKKSRFTTTYVMICATLWVFIWFNSFLIYDAFIMSDVHWIIKAIPVFTLLFFVFNVFNIVSLYYPLFEDDLEMCYKFQKKPDNWMEEGRELNDDDEITDIMRRDFGI